MCVGKSTLSECNDADRVPVSEIHLHEQWQSDALREGFDIALLKLDRPLPNQLSQLADTAAEPPVGEMVNARGWGVSGYDGDTRLFLDEMQRFSPTTGAVHVRNRIDLRRERPLSAF